MDTLIFHDPGLGLRLNCLVQNHGPLKIKWNHDGYGGDDAPVMCSPGHTMLIVYLWILRQRWHYIHSMPISNCSFYVQKCLLQTSVLERMHCITVKSNYSAIFQQQQLKSGLFLLHCQVAVNTWPYGLLVMQVHDVHQGFVFYILI